MLSVGCILTCWSFVKNEPEAMDTRRRTATSSVLGLRMRKHGQIYGGRFGRSLLTFKSEYQQGEPTRVGEVPYPNPNTNPNHRRRSASRFHTLPHSHRCLTYVYACVDLRGERTQAREKNKGVHLVKTYAILKNLRAVAKKTRLVAESLERPVNVRRVHVVARKSQGVRQVFHVMGAPRRHKQQVACIPRRPIRSARRTIRLQHTRGITRIHYIYGRNATSKQRRLRLIGEATEYAPGSTSTAVVYTLGSRRWGCACARGGGSDIKAPPENCGTHLLLAHKRLLSLAAPRAFEPRRGCRGRPQRRGRGSPPARQGTKEGRPPWGTGATASCPREGPSRSAT